MNAPRVLGTGIALLVFTASLVASDPLEAAAIGGLNTVTVSPGHGKAVSPFQMTYAITP
jgi:hypothetical protein